jgi:hypothetical protein
MNHVKKARSAVTNVANEAKKQAQKQSQEGMKQMANSLSEAAAAPIRKSLEEIGKNIAVSTVEKAQQEIESIIATITKMINLASGSPSIFDQIQGNFDRIQPLLSKLTKNPEELLSELPPLIKVTICCCVNKEGVKEEVLSVCEEFEKTAITFQQLMSEPAFIGLLNAIKQINVGEIFGTATAGIKEGLGAMADTVSFIGQFCSSGPSDIVKNVGTLQGNLSARGQQINAAAAKLNISDGALQQLTVVIEKHGKSVFKSILDELEHVVGFMIDLPRRLRGAVKNAMNFPCLLPCAECLLKAMLPAAVVVICEKLEGMGDTLKAVASGVAILGKLILSFDMKQINAVRGELDSINREFTKSSAICGAPKISKPSLDDSMIADVLEGRALVDSNGKLIKRSDGMTHVHIQAYNDYFFICSSGIVCRDKDGTVEGTFVRLQPFDNIYWAIIGCLDNYMCFDLNEARVPSLRTSVSGGWERFMIIAVPGKVGKYYIYNEEHGTYLTLNSDGDVVNDLKEASEGSEWRILKD